MGNSPARGMSLQDPRKLRAGAWHTHLLLQGAEQSGKCPGSRRGGSRPLGMAPTEGCVPPPERPWGQGVCRAPGLRAAAESGLGNRDPRNSLEAGAPAGPGLRVGGTASREEQQAGRGLRGRQMAGTEKRKGESSMRRKLGSQLPPGPRAVTGRRRARAAPAPPNCRGGR